MGKEQTRWIDEAMSDFSSTLETGFRVENNDLVQGTKDLFFLGGRGGEGFVNAATLGAYNQIKGATEGPDYSGPLDAAQRQFEEEKRRRAMEANRRDLQASQLARLFLSDMGTQDETFNFMGL